MKLITAPTKSQQIADFIEKNIKSGELSPGSRLYGMRELTRKFSVSIAVINSAYNILEKKKLINRQHGKGTYVSHTAGQKHKVVALLTTWRQEYSEGYFEALLEAAHAGNYLVIPVTLEPNKLSSCINTLKAQNPSAFLVDLEGLYYPLNDILKYTGNIPVCFVNRWEWTKKPECGVFTDYCGMFIDMVERLKAEGHKRIMFLGFNQKPLPFMEQDLSSCAAHFGLKCPSYEFEYLAITDFDKYPERIARIFGGKDYPTAVFSRADNILLAFDKKIHTLYSHIGKLKLIGTFNTSWSHIPGMEFDSYSLDFKTMWTLALSKFSREAAPVEKCTPQLLSATNIPNMQHESWNHIQSKNTRTKSFNFN